MNNDLISREALREELNKQIAHFKNMENNTDIIPDRRMYHDTACGLMKAKNIIDNAPTVKTYCYFCGQTEHGRVEERPQGEWSFNPYDSCSYCSLCKVKAPFGYKNFCPNCGADMRKGGAE